MLQIVPHNILLSSAGCFGMTREPAIPTGASRSSGCDIILLASAGCSGMIRLNLPPLRVPEGFLVEARYLGIHPHRSRDAAHGGNSQ
jgi:hypothetical protein